MDCKQSWRERHRAHFADNMKRRQKVLEAEALENGTLTAITTRQVVFAIGIIIFTIGVLGLLLINC